MTGYGEQHLLPFIILYVDYNQLVSIIIKLQNLLKILKKEITDIYFQYFLSSIYKLSTREMKEEKQKKKEGGHHQGLQTIKIVDGKYLIKNKKLGQGSFAQTYLAIDNSNHHQLACKMISKQNLIQKINASKQKNLAKEYFITALKNEVNTWKNISHQNIVQFIDFSETSNNIYFFLEFCSQGNL